MKSIIQGTLAVTTISLSSFVFAADPLANTEWTTIDDNTNKPAAVIKITEKNGVFTGKMTDAYLKADKKYVGKTIISGLKADGNGKYSGGKIYDPENGKKYTLKIIRKGNSLNVRGYIGPFYRTQVWKKK